MPITSTYPTSRRGYLSQSELEQYADITITDTTEADDQISQAEELIDAYVGFIQRHFRYVIQGKAVSASSTSLTLQADQQTTNYTDYYKGLNIEIIGGTGAGQRRKITASTAAGVLTTETFTTAPDSTSVYKIYQLGKFPRQKDVFFDSVNSPSTYYKNIPEEVKRAVAAQVQFMIQMGSAFFASDKSNLDSETIGDYSYTKSGGSSGSLETLIAPKAKALLRGIVNRTGTMVV